MTPAPANDSLAACEGPLSASVDGVLFDLDGVVYRGNAAVEHAVASITDLNIPFGFITNNASRSPQDVARHLTELGISADPGQVTTSAQAAADYIASAYGQGAKVLVVGGEGLRAAVAERDLAVVVTAEEHADIVVQGTSSTLTWADLAEGVYAINRGAHYIATNLDATMPTERGMGPGNGAMVAAVSHATGIRPERAAGKPDPQIFRHAARRAGMSRPIVVGDRLDTDIMGARAAGIPALLVLTGVDTPRRLLRSPAAQRPTYVSTDLRGLHRSHPPVTSLPGGWHCGNALARTDGGELVVTEEGRRAVLTGTGTPASITMDALRAACAAAWESPQALDLDREIQIHP